MSKPRGTDQSVAQTSGGYSDIAKRLGRIVKPVNANRRKLVSVLVNGTPLKTMPDTGSYWDCMSQEGLRKLKVSVEDLKNPTDEMNNTQTATGSAMKPLGYLEVDISLIWKL